MVNFPFQRVVVVLDNVRSLYNTGSILRTADASGVEVVVLCGITPRPDQGSRQRRAIAKTALGAEESVAWEYEPTTSAALQRFRNGESINIRGASGNLDYSPSTEETTGPIDVWTIDTAATPPRIIAESQSVSPPVTTPSP